MLQHYLLVFRQVGSAGGVTPPSATLRTWQALAPLCYFTAGELMNFDSLAQRCMIESEAPQAHFETIQPLPHWSAE